ncbi:MAG: RluA family pseudouridine synthase [Oscillospiraceae bacterium]
MARKLEFFIDNSYDGKKVNDFLRGEIKASHRLICKLKAEPLGITINGTHARTVDILKSGDLFSIIIPDDDVKTSVKPMDLPLDIIYEDDDVIVINKPAMLAMHESHNHQGDTLSNALCHYLLSHNKNAVFRAVGRLDKGTSGLVVCAVNKYSAARLSGKIYKEYLAIVSGIYEGEGTIDAPIYRPDPIITVRTVSPLGEKAITHWKSIRNDGENTLLRIHLETGRTHQIRVHFAHLKTPLIGDTMYGQKDERICHQALHCCFCRFKHPVSGEIIECSADMPMDMKNII